MSTIVMRKKTVGTLCMSLYIFTVVKKKDCRSKLLSSITHGEFHFYIQLQNL